MLAAAAAETPVPSPGIGTCRSGGGSGAAGARPGRSGADAGRVPGGYSCDVRVPPPLSPPLSPPPSAAAEPAPVRNGEEPNRDLVGEEDIPLPRAPPAASFPLPIADTLTPAATKSSSSAPWEDAGELAPARREGGDRDGVEGVAAELAAGQDLSSDMRASRLRSTSEWVVIPRILLGWSVTRRGR